MTTAKKNGILEKLPQVLAIQKKKFLIAINRLEHDDAAAECFSQAEEKLLEDMSVAQLKLLYPTGKCPPTKQWNDSVAIQCVKDTLQKHSVFDLNKYLNCADIVCKLFTTKETLKENACAVIEYVLTHARQFGDPTKTIFQIEASANKVSEISFDNCVLTRERSSGTRQQRVKQLISDLRVKYDETNFETLNTHITSFSLIILRRSMKRGITTHNSKLSSICLVIQAYLNSDDEITKKNIQDACIRYIEWHNMQLPALLFKVIDLYEIEAGELWDFLSSINNVHVARSLINLAKVYYYKYQLSRAEPKQDLDWFAYCQLFGDEYHSRLANVDNVQICSLLSILLEMKAVNEPVYVFKYSTIRYKMWATTEAYKLCQKIKK